MSTPTDPSARRDRGRDDLPRPAGRAHAGLSANARAGLSALATGILVFLFWDVMTNAVDPIDTALHAHHWGEFSKLAALGVRRVHRAG